MTNCNGWIYAIISCSPLRGWCQRLSIPACIVILKPVPETPAIGPVGLFIWIVTLRLTLGLSLPLTAERYVCHLWLVPMLTRKNWMTSGWATIGLMYMRSSFSRWYETWTWTLRQSSTGNLSLMHVVYNKTSIFTMNYCFVANCMDTT